MSNIIVFRGPSLPSVPDKSWEPLFKGVQVYPPAQQGNIHSAIIKGFKIADVISVGIRQQYPLSNTFHPY